VGSEIEQLCREPGVVGRVTPCAPRLQPAGAKFPCRRLRTNQFNHRWTQMNTDKENRVAAKGANFSGIGNDFPGGACLRLGAERRRRQKPCKLSFF